MFESFRVMFMMKAFHEGLQTQQVMIHKVEPAR